jgi:hypothetical protein
MAQVDQNNNRFQELWTVILAQTSHAVMRQVAVLHHRHPPYAILNEIFGIGLCPHR